MNGTLWVVLSQIFYILLASFFSFLLGWWLRGRKEVEISLRDQKEANEALEACQRERRKAERARLALKKELAKVSEEHALAEGQTAQNEEVAQLKGNTRTLRTNSSEQSKAVSDKEEVDVQSVSGKNALPEVAENNPEPTRREGESDDLTKIKGVGRVLSQKLSEKGIYTYRDLIEWDGAQKEAFEARLSFKGRIKREKWQEQARQLYEEKKRA